MGNVLKTMQSKFYKDGLLILLLVIIALVIGIFLADDYGLSWDEYRDITYGDVVLRAYKGDQSFRWEETNRHYYGPFHWMLVSLVADIVSPSWASVQAITIWKIVCYVVFLVGIISFYFLCRRFIDRLPAFVTTILLLTQPLLLGHAFINQKDIPFMTYFILSITIGLQGSDAFHRRVQRDDAIQDDNVEGILGKWQEFSAKWNSASRRKKNTLRLLLLLLFGSTLELFFVKQLVLPMLQRTVTNAYASESFPLINRLFEIIAGEADIWPLEMYLAKVGFAYLLGSVLIVFGLTFLSHCVWQKIIHDGYSCIPQKETIKRIMSLLLPAIFLGLLISIRIVGIFAGILVSGYFLYRSRHRAIAPLLVYWVVAACVSYATWPYLWGAPVSRFVESIQEVGNFSSLTTLFHGVIQASENMPIYYLPFLLAAQLTEPTLILILLGLIIMISKWRKHELKTAYLLLLAAWITVPVLAEIVLRVPIYDNFRQFLFIVPPLILITSWGIAYLYRRIKPNWLAVTLMMVTLLPGIWGIAKLHPYEYVYYNAIVGGIDNAYGEYELDYWCTSLKEAMSYLEENATPNSTVYISGPIDAAAPYAREDLKIVRDRTLIPYPDYVVACRNVVLSEEFYPDYKIIHEVGIGQGVFAVIKEKVSDS